ncbi:MAG: hypothetical protein LBL87_04180 [Ruminococcus sp.]|jgi:hypothetical protein|nr:hypothetical protein [Ruminococcus sp.]
MKKLISTLLATVISLSLFSACEKAEPTIAETIPETAIVTTTTVAPETTATTLAETTILTTTAETTILTTTAATTIETAPPETEPTTTASITTADNSSDTRTTQQKLDNIIAANPDVEIGYALYNADTNEYLFHFNDEMTADLSKDPNMYWIFRILDQNELYSENRFHSRAHVSEGNSPLYDLYKNGQKRFTIHDYIYYFFYYSDMDAREMLSILEPITYSRTVTVGGKTILVKSRHSSISSVTQGLAQWADMYEFISTGSDEGKFLKELLSGTDNKAYFYEGTGVSALHFGDNSNETSEIYDTGLFNANGNDYIFVIYTRNADSADIVRDISRYFYDEVK